MQALRYVSEVEADGRIIVRPHGLKQGTSVEVIILVRESDEELSDLLAASESSLAFWDNPVDDEVWNAA